MITKALYALLHRNDVRAWVLGLALGCVWLSAGAVNKNNIGRWGVNQNGRTTTLTPGAPTPNTGGSTIPVSPSSGGWTQAGNYGVPMGATGPTAGLNVNGVFIQGERGNFNIGGAGGVQGVRYPAGGSYQIPWGTVAPVAAGIVCAVATAGVCGVASGVAAASPYIMEWLDRGGLKRNAETGAVEKPVSGEEYVESDGYAYYINWSGQTTGYRATRQLACAAAPEMARAAYAAAGRPNVVVGGAELVGGVCRVEQDGTVFDHSINQGGASDCPAGWFVTPFGCFSPSNLPRVAQTVDQVIDALTKVNPDPRVWGEVLEKGGEIPMPNPTVTGPTQIQGPERSTTNPDGSRTVERTTYNFQTAGNTVNNTSNVTTTTTYNTDNSVRSVSTTTTTPVEEEAPEGECEKRPNTIGCADMDTPTGEIPRETKTITYAEESVFGGGGCPSDKQWSSGTTGSSYKLIDWQLFCGYALPARFLVILLATFAAFLIVMPGKEVRT